MLLTSVHGPQARKARSRTYTPSETAVIRPSRSQSAQLRRRLPAGRSRPAVCARRRRACVSAGRAYRAGGGSPGCARARNARGTRARGFGGRFSRCGGAPFRGRGARRLRNQSALCDGTPGIRGGPGERRALDFIFLVRSPGARAFPAGTLAVAHGAATPLPRPCHRGRTWIFKQLSAPG